ncbi:MAG: amino acid permease [Planctomycetes bacterium]|nr:amino acid permease [Planctomycetota bacterium]
MRWKQMWARKSLDTLLAEMSGENRLRRILGPISLTMLGVGAIIGSGIFVMTGRAAAQDAGPAIMVSYCVAGLGCALAAFCYAEFASLAPVAGSAYTYAYATLGELLAWIIGWDLVLEYAMSCATVASAWAKYFNSFLNVFGVEIPKQWMTDPFTYTGGGFAMNVPAVCIMLVVTAILVIGIRESAMANAILTCIKLGVVLFVVGLGAFYVNPNNWTGVSMTERRTPVESHVVPGLVKEEVSKEGLSQREQEQRVAAVGKMVSAAYRLEHIPQEVKRLQAAGKLTDEQAAAEIERNKARWTPQLAQNEADKKIVDALLGQVHERAPETLTDKWGILGFLGLDKLLTGVDDSFRSNFMPFGLSGVMMGAAIVFFAFIGFDSISTHAEEAIKPQRDVPIGIIASLAICTVLYLLVCAIITGMVPHPDINDETAVADAFIRQAKLHDSPALHYSSALISTGALAGMTSVLLITFLSQSRVFLAMARDHLLPPSIFGAVHPKFKTPHISTMWTGAIICVVAAFTPIHKLEEMVNIGTLFAFVVVCASVLILRIKRPDAHRPFRTPLLWLVAPLGIVVNVTMMLFLPVDTWIRLFVWLGIGLVIYFTYGQIHSILGHELRDEIQKHGLTGSHAKIN